MPSAPRDSVCPSCGENVGVRATFCIHCGAEFERPDGVDDGPDAPSPLETLRRAADRLRHFGAGKLLAAVAVPATVGGVLLDVALSLSLVGTVVALVAWTGLVVSLFECGPARRAAIRSVLGAVVFLILVPLAFWGAGPQSGTGAPIGFALGPVAVVYAVWALVTVDVSTEIGDDTARASGTDPGTEADSDAEADYEYEVA